MQDEGGGKWEPCRPSAYDVSSRGGSDGKKSKKKKKRYLLDRDLVGLRGSEGNDKKSCLSDVEGSKKKKKTRKTLRKRYEKEPEEQEDSEQEESWLSEDASTEDEGAQLSRSTEEQKILKRHMDKVIPAGDSPRKPKKKKDKEKGKRSSLIKTSTAMPSPRAIFMGNKDNVVGMAVARDLDLEPPRNNTAPQQTNLDLIQLNNNNGIERGRTASPPLSPPSPVVSPRRTASTEEKPPQVVREPKKHLRNHVGDLLSKSNLFPVGKRDRRDSDATKSILRPMTSVSDVNSLRRTSLRGNNTFTRSTKAKQVPATMRISARNIVYEKRDQPNTAKPEMTGEKKRGLYDDKTATASNGNIEMRDASAHFGRMRSPKRRSIEAMGMIDLDEGIQPKIGGTVAAGKIRKDLEQLQSLGFKASPQVLNCMLRIIDMEEEIEELPPDVLKDIVFHVKRFLVNTNLTIKVATLRLLRRYLRFPGLLDEILSQCVQYFIVRCMELSDERTLERTEALKLVREIAERESAKMPRIVVQSLISIVQFPRDPYCRVCLEVLCEIAIRNIEIVGQSRNGVKVIFKCAVDPFYKDQQPSVVACLLYLFNHQQCRNYIRPSSDVGLLFTPLTDTHCTDAATTREKWTVCVQLIVRLLTSWTGLLFLAAHELGLKTFVNSLKLPNEDLLDILLDALYVIFRVNNRVDREKKSEGSISVLEEQPLPSRTIGKRPNLLNNFLAVLLSTFVDCGLIEALAGLGGRQSRVTAKATNLLGELLHMSNTLLPHSQCTRIQTLPSLLKSAVSFQQHPRHWVAAGAVVTELDKFSALKSTTGSETDFQENLVITGADKYRRLKGRDRRLDRIDNIKRKMDLMMDSKQLTNKIQQTQVLLKHPKEFDKWAWDAVQEVLEGPLRNTTHLNETLKKNSQFFDRLLTFLLPSSHLFSSLRRSNDNVKYVRVGCQVLEVLLMTEDGKKYLDSDKLLTELSALLQALIENKPDPTGLVASFSDPTMMAREYFTLIGTLSSSMRGLKVMKEKKLFRWLRTLAQQGQHDLRYAALTCLDYSKSSGPARPMLQKCLTSPDVGLRMAATKHMRVLLRAGVEKFSAWGVELLLKQLSDNDSGVCEEALSILDEACDTPACLESLVDKRPSLEQMKAGKDLLLRFLSLERGFDYLFLESNFVELKDWQQQEIFDYTRNLEASIDQAFSMKGADGNLISVYAPPHFYGELAKTKKGFKALKHSQHFQAMMQTIQNQLSMPFKRRAALWAVGHIGASRRGLKLLQNDGAISEIVQLAETAGSLAIRGTCIYVLGLIASTEEGRTELRKLGWESPSSQCHICVPKSIRSLLKLSTPERLEPTPVLKLPQFPPGDHRTEVFDLLSAIGHTVHTGAKAEQLLRHARKYPDVLTSYPVMAGTFQILEMSYYKLDDRRYIHKIIPTVAFTEEFFNKALPEYMAQVRDDLKPQKKGDPKRRSRTATGEPSNLEPVEGLEGKNKKKKKRKNRHGTASGSRIEMRKEENKINNTGNNNKTQQETTTNKNDAKATSTGTNKPTTTNKNDATEQAQGEIVIYNTLYESGNQGTKVGKKDAHPVVKKESPSPPEAIAASDAIHTTPTTPTAVHTKDREEKEVKEKAEQPDNTLSL